MNLFDLQLSTSLTDVEKTIVREFLRNSTLERDKRLPYADVYRTLARSLHLKVVEIKAIEKEMILRINAEAIPIQPVSEVYYGHGAVVLDLIAPPAR